MRIQKPIHIPYGDMFQTFLDAMEKLGKTYQIQPMAPRVEDLRKGCVLRFRLGSY